MKIKITLSFLVLSISSPSFSNEIECRVEYFDKKEQKSSGVGQPMEYWNDFAIYKKCKNFCFILNAPKEPNNNEITGCYINKIPLENSKYKPIYNKQKNKICHITAYKNGKIYGGHYIDVASDENSCKKSIASKYWCLQGYECKYTYGKW